MSDCYYGFYVRIYWYYAHFIANICYVFIINITKCDINWTGKKRNVIILVLFTCIFLVLFINVFVFFSMKIKSFSCVFFSSDQQFYCRQYVEMESCKELVNICFTLWMCPIKKSNRFFVMLVISLILIIQWFTLGKLYYLYIILHTIT